MQPSKSYRQEFWQTLVLATPIIVNQLSHMITQITDSIMVGHLSTTALAASSFSGAVFALFIIFCFGFSSILSSWIAKSIGENELHKVGKILRHGLVLNLIVSVMCFGVLLIVIENLDIFRQSDAVSNESKDFLFYIGLSLVPLSLFAVYTRFCEGVSDPGSVTILSWCGVGLNLVLNWVLIYGHWGLPAMGLKGSGLATLCTRLILMLIIIFYVHGKKQYQKYAIQLDFSDLNLKFLYTIFKTSLPSGLMHLNEVSAFAGGGIMMGWISAEALASHHIALNLASCTFIVAMGWSFATTVRVAEEFGKKDWVSVRRVGVSSFLSMVLLMGVTSLLFVIFRYQLPLLYTQDKEVIELSSQLLLIAALFQLFDGTQVLGISLNKGIMDVKIPLVITFFSYWGVCLPACYIFSFVFKIGPMGIWYGYLACLIVASVLLNGRFFYLVKTKRAYL